MTNFHELETAFARFKARHGRIAAEELLMRVARVKGVRQVSRQYLGDVIRAFAEATPPGAGV